MSKQKAEKMRQAFPWEGNINADAFRCDLSPIYYHIHLSRFVYINAYVT